MKPKTTGSIDVDPETARQLAGKTFFAHHCQCGFSAIGTNEARVEAEYKAHIALDNGRRFE